MWNLLIIQCILLLFLIQLTNAGKKEKEAVVVVDQEEYYSGQEEYVHEDESDDDNDYDYYPTTTYYTPEYLDTIDNLNDMYLNKNIESEAQRNRNEKELKEIAYPFLHSFNNDNIVKLLGSLDGIKFLNKYILTFLGSAVNFEIFKNEVENYLKSQIESDNKFVKEKFKDLSKYLKKLTKDNFPQIFTAYEECKSGEIFKKNKRLFKQLKTTCENVEDILSKMMNVDDEKYDDKWAEKMKIENSKEDINNFLNNWKSYLEKLEENLKKKEEHKITKRRSFLFRGSSSSDQVKDDVGLLL